MMPTPALPNAWGAADGRVNASVLNQRSTVRCVAESSGCPMRCGRNTIAAKIEDGAPTQNYRQWHSALYDVHAGNLPVAKKAIRSSIPRLSPPFVLSPRKFVNIADYQTVRDVEFRRTPFRPQIIRVLRYAEYAEIDTGPCRTCRKVVGSLAQRLSPGVACETRQTSRKSVLQAQLQRMIVGKSRETGNRCGRSSWPHQHDY